MDTSHRNPDSGDSGRRILGIDSPVGRGTCQVSST